MFYHVKELQYNARVSKPDPRFASLLLEQFGGANGELSAALQYFTQAFSARMPFPKHYDLLMDIATEEFSHLEVVGATITMLLEGINGDLKNAAEESEIMKLMEGKEAKETLIHQALNNQFLVVTGGGPALTNSQGAPWTSSYVSANGDLTVDLRSNIAAEARAKIVYEYLMQFTDDPYVKETLRFLMTREVAHAQMFEAGLEEIKPNFPPGTLQGDPRYSNVYLNLSNGENIRGPWNEGKSPGLGESWQYIEDPMQHIMATNGMANLQPQGTERTLEETELKNKEMSDQRSGEIRQAVPRGEKQWSRYSQSGQSTQV